MKRGLVGPALLAALLVAGCSNEPERPSALPPVSIAPSPSASPEPSVPAEAQAETPQAAAEFARFWYDEIERAFAAKDPEVIRRLSAPGCETCELFTASLTKLRDKNERTTDVVYDVKFAEAPAIDGEEVLVDVIYDSPAIKRFDSSGTVIREEPAVEGFEETLVLVRSGDTWLVREVRAVQ